MNLYKLLRVGSTAQKTDRRAIFCFSLRDSLRALGLLLGASLLCLLFQQLGSLDTLVPLFFVLATLTTSACTDGYFYGVIAAFLSVFGVNYAFTYPYFSFNFSIAGYPLTFAIMLAVSVFTSTIMSSVKQQERIRRETEMEKARANLLRSVSHDLRTPLTSIAGAANVLLENEGLDAETRRALLENARNDAQWLIRMVENLLSITRVGAVDTKLDMEPEAVEEVISEAVTKFKRQPRHVPVRVTVPEEALFVPMNALLIEQVLLNLFDNSVTHGEKTTQIWVSVSVVGEYAVFSLEDDGVGIAGGQPRPSLLTDLPQNVSDGKRDMGIGLSVCETIIRAHRGHVQSGASRTHGGARFVFMLPLKEEKNASQE